MNFLHPAAFIGLASLLVLILLSLWRQRPARVIVPSVRLWERIPDRLPPVRALRRPRATPSLLLQMLIAAAVVSAMAGPGVTRTKEGPRRIVVVVDSSAYMSPRASDASRELEKLDRSDDITTIETLDLRRHGQLFHYHSVAAGVVDPVPALDLAASEANVIVYVSDRPPAWKPPTGVTFHLVLVGGPLDNNGIVDAGEQDGKLFIRLLRSAEVEVMGKRMPAAAFHLVDAPADATRITASLEPDAFEGDDRVEFERTEGRVEVGFAGRPDPSVLAAIESNSGARVVRGGSPRLLIRIGARAEGTAPFIVDVDPAEGIGLREDPGEISIAKHELTEGMEAEDLQFTEVGALAGTLEAPLIYSSGKPMAALRNRGEIVVAAKYASTGWPARPSFPIFWANVIRYAASGIGTWSAKGLLDESASRLGRDRKPLDPAAFGPRAPGPVRTDLTGVWIAVAALLLALLWRVESRPAASE